jgi:hypothetical protein
VRADLDRVVGRARDAFDGEGHRTFPITVRRRVRYRDERGANAPRPMTEPTRHTRSRSARGRAPRPASRPRIGWMPEGAGSGRTSRGDVSVELSLRGVHPGDRACQRPDGVCATSRACQENARCRPGREPRRPRGSMERAKPSCGGIAPPRSDVEGLTNLCPMRRVIYHITITTDGMYADPTAASAVSTRRGRAPLREPPRAGRRRPGHGPRHV